MSAYLLADHKYPALSTETGKFVHVNQTGGDNLHTFTQLASYPDGLARIPDAPGEQPIGKSSPLAGQMTRGTTEFSRLAIQAAMVSPS
jgi:hypothetical protein